jgi:hypothetical protein
MQKEITMSDDCKNLEMCPIFKQFKVQGLANVWIRLYCKGSSQSDCVRKQKKEAGEEVPLNMLPDGSLLKNLQPV